MAPNKRKMEEKSVIQLEGMAFKKQENTTTKQILALKIHTKELHMKLVHPKKNMLGTTAQHLQ